MTAGWWKPLKHVAHRGNELRATNPLRLRRPSPNWLPRPQKAKSRIAARANPEAHASPKPNLWPTAQPKPPETKPLNNQEKPGQAHPAFLLALAVQPDSMRFAASSRNFLHSQVERRPRGPASENRRRSGVVTMATGQMRQSNPRDKAQNFSSDISSARAVGAMPTASSRASISGPIALRLERSILRRWLKAIAVSRDSMTPLAG